ncbi:hypothetical protein Avbf_12005 [Armadillidium vulgare]|nr:hypothetical protein Avbf_12005 [Armadillidium vulgare]
MNGDKMWIDLRYENLGEGDGVEEKASPSLFWGDGTLFNESEISKFQKPETKAGSQLYIARMMNLTQNFELIHTNFYWSYSICQLCPIV